MTHVQLTDLNKSYDGRSRAVNGLTLSIASGQITALLGPSGCGKTTILKMIAGLLAPNQGDITFNDRSVLAIPAEKRNAVMVFQSHLLFPTMNVADNVGFGLKMRGIPKKEIARQVAALLALVKLPGYESRRPGELSGGQQQRVALARALITEPAVLLLDEPLSNLDAHLRDEMRDLIRTIQRKLGITTIVVTHDQQTAVLLADQIALLFAGELHQVGPPVAFYERPLSCPIARFFGGSNFIPGQKWGYQVETSLGVFVTEADSFLPDGPVTLTIRPENIQFVANEGDNVLSGQILSHVYAGTHTRFQINTSDPNQSPLTVIAAATSQNQYQPGDSVHLHLPGDKLWLMPANNG